MDEIFQADVDRFGSLKDVLKFIFEQLNKQSTKINDVDTKMVAKFMQISEIKKLSEKIKEDIIGVNVVIKELEHKSCVAEEDLSELKSDMEAARMNLILSNGRVKKNG